MCFTLETFLIHYLKQPFDQDKFKSSVFQHLLNQHFDVLNSDYVEDVIQILHKCIIELEKLQVLKYKDILEKKRQNIVHVS